MSSEDIVIVAAQRTPIGAFLGGLSTLSAPKLGGFAHQAAMSAAQLSPKDIDEVISGCVLQAGIGQAPARQAAILANIPYSTGATTLNKMCGSGMKAVMFGHDLIRAGSAKIVLASGMESMSSAPYVLSKARAGYRLGHGEIKDHMFLDGLEDAYEPGKLMGCFAEETAKEYAQQHQEWLTGKDQEQHIKQLELDAELKTLESQQLKRQELQEKLEADKILHHNRLQHMHLEAEAQERELLAEAIKSKDEYLRREIEFLVLDRQRAELSKSIRGANLDINK